MNVINKLLNAKNLLQSMDKNLNSRANLQIQSSNNDLVMNLGQSSQDEDEKLKSCEGRVFIPQNGFWQNVKTFSLFRVLKCYIVRWRYIAALWLTREIAIITILRENYEKVPPGTMSKVIAKSLPSRVITKILGVLRGMLFPLGSIQKISVVQKTDNN